MRDTNKSLVCAWVKNEFAAFWQDVLTDLKARGIEDILVSVTDNLNEFTQVNTKDIPEINTQICVIHRDTKFN